MTETPTTVEPSGQADPTNSGSLANVAARFRAMRQHPAFPDALLGFVTGSIFLGNLAISFLVQGDGIWQTGRANGYLLHLMVTLAGFHLFLTGPLLIEGLLTPGEQTGYYPGLPYFILAIVSIVWIITAAKRVPTWRRAMWAYLIGAQLAGFAAVHWSTLGN